MGNIVVGDNVLPSVSSSIIERPTILVHLNETVVLRQEIQIELPPCFDYPPNLNCHNETSIDDVDNLSYHVDSSIARLDSALHEDDEMKFVILSSHEELRGLLSITPTNLE